MAPADDAVARNADFGIVARNEPHRQRLAVDRDDPFAALPANGGGDIRRRRPRAAAAKRASPRSARAGRRARRRGARRARSPSGLGRDARRRRVADEVGRRLAFDEVRPPQRADQEIAVGRHARDERRLERAHKPGPRLLAVGAEGDDLGEQGIVEGRDRRAALDAAVDAHALAFGARQATIRPVDGRKSAAGSSA